MTAETATALRNRCFPHPHRASSFVIVDYEKFASDHDDDLDEDYDNTDYDNPCAWR